MTWLFFAFLCAFAEGLKDIASKRGLQTLDPLSIAWVFFFLTTLFCAPLLLVDGIPTLGPHFWWALLAHGTLYCCGVCLYMRAISMSDLSLVVPLTAFTPVFLLLTAPLLLGEWPTKLGLLGILLVVVGSYLLNITSLRDGLLAPFRALLREPGARLMLLVTIIYSITPPIDKIGIANSSPIFWGVFEFAFMTLISAPFLILRAPGGVRALAAQWRIVLPLGMCNAVQMIGYVFAMRYGLAVYVLAIKRTSILLVILLGAMVFDEQHMKQRILGAVCMLVGVFCIVY